jgi:hypothetical protein
MEGYSSAARVLAVRAANSARTVFSCPFNPTGSRGIKNQAAESSPKPIYLFLPGFVRKISVVTDFFMGLRNRVLALHSPHWKNSPRMTQSTLMQVQGGILGLAGRDLCD